MGVRDVCIDLSSRNVAVTKEGLDGANVGAIHEEVGSKTVPEGMRRDVFSDAGGAGVFLDNTLDGARSKTAEIARSVYGLGVTAVIKKKSWQGIVTSI